MDVLSELKHYSNIFIDNFSNSIYFSFFPVLIHELGHVFAAKIIGGHVDDIRMILSEKQQ